MYCWTVTGQVYILCEDGTYGVIVKFTVWIMNSPLQLTITQNLD
jgi:roadblock/LC7 domain-containing protein